MLPDNSKESIGLENLNALERQLKESPYALQRFSDKLVVMLSDRGQQIINLSTWKGMKQNWSVAVIIIVTVRGMMCIPICLLLL